MERFPPAAASPPRAPGRRAGARRWRKAALLLVIVGGMTALVASGAHRWLTFENLRENRAALLAFTQRHYLEMLVGATLAYTLATALNFPVGVLLTLAVGLLFGRWVGTVVVVVAASVGATLAFLAARYLFADAARRRMGPVLTRLTRGYAEDGFHYILFTRLVPVFPFWLMNLVPAFTPVSARTFFLATALGIIPGTFVFANLGESLGRIESPDDLVRPGTLVALALLGVLSLVPVAWKRMRTPARKDAHG